MDYEQKFKIGDVVKGIRTFNGEIIEGKFNGFCLHNKLNPTSVVGVIMTHNGFYYVSVDSIEFAESEDERIRKSLIALVRQSSEVLSKQNQESMLAWLEKQGKSNPYSGVSFEYNGNIWGMCARDNGVDILCDKHIIGHLEKQGEQKSPWSEEDDRILYNVIAYVGFAAGQRGVKNDAFREANKWLKSLKDRIQSQSKQEWNKEDEEKIMWLVMLISTAGYRELDNDKMPCSRIELLDWLKSIKPRWKPTKEQMEALKYFISFHRPQANAAVEGWKEFKNLESLYNDLKSL